MNRVFQAEESAWSSWLSRGRFVVLAYSYVVSGLVLANVLGGPLRIVLAAPLLGFLPGYAVLDALFPTVDSGGSAGESRRLSDELSWSARVAIAVGLSIVLLPLLVVLLGTSGVALTTTPLTLTLLVVVTVGITIGSYRRIRHGTAEGYRVPTQQWRAELSAATIEAESRIDAALTVGLILVVVLAMTGFAYGLAAPDRGSSYTEVALLDQQGDELVAGNYPDTVTRGEPIDVTLTVENQEGVETEYTVLFVLERVRTAGDDADVLERERLDRRTVTVADGETLREQISVEPTMLGNDLRLSVLVVEGETPSVIDSSTADHHLYLWIDVSATPEPENENVGEPSSNRHPSYRHPTQQGVH